jgi:hypothetical protein
MIPQGSLPQLSNRIALAGGRRIMLKQAEPFLYLGAEATLA